MPPHVGTAHTFANSVHLKGTGRIGKDNLCPASGLANGSKPRPGSHHKPDTAPRRQTNVIAVAFGYRFIRAGDRYARRTSSTVGGCPSHTATT